MEWTPEDGPIAMILHSNRRSQNFFGGGQDGFHVFFCDLLFEDLPAWHTGDNSYHDREPMMRLAGCDGDQDEKQCEGSHDLSP